MTGITGALILTLIAGSATGIGGALVLFKKKLSSNFLAGALGLSAGVMIFISLAELFGGAVQDYGKRGISAWRNMGTYLILHRNGYHHPYRLPHS